MTDLVRDSIELNYKGQTKTLDVTLGVIEQVGRKVKLMALAVQFGNYATGEDFDLDLVACARLIEQSLLVAGFDKNIVSVDEIYDELMAGEDEKSYMVLVGNLLAIYTPKGKAEKKPQSRKPRSSKKKA